SLRLAFFAGFGSLDLTAAHRFRCAAAIARRPFALIFRFGASVLATGLCSVPARSDRSSAIWASSLRFCCSKPTIAASIISLVSFLPVVIGMCLLPRHQFGTILAREPKALTNDSIRRAADRLREPA